jgi:hypothetical protein
LADNAAENSELRSVWWQQISGNPIAYLAHRSAVFAQLIGLGSSVNLQYWDLDLSRNPAQYAIARNPANALITSYLAAFRRPITQTFFFRAIIWILACLYLGYRALRSSMSSDRSFVLVLVSSSLLYIFTYFFIAPAADFRYIFWPGIASTLAIIFGFYLVRSERNTARAMAV